MSHQLLEQSNRSWCRSSRSAHYCCTPGALCLDTKSREVRLSTVASPWLRLFLANYWPNGCVQKHKHPICICASHMYACMIMHVSVTYIYIYIHDIHVYIYHYHALWCIMYNDVCSIMFPENSHRFISYQWIAHGFPWTSQTGELPIRHLLKPPGPTTWARKVS